MKKSLLFLALIFISFNVSIGQNTMAMVEVDSENVGYEKEIIDNSNFEIEKNKFRVIEKEVIKQIQKEVKFPAIAYEYGVEGTVLIQFVFDGAIKDLKVVKSLGAGCDASAIEALKKFPQLYQELGGKEINDVVISIPFKFEM